MVEITKLNDAKMTINCDLIETVESTPDTMITLTTGKKLIAKDSIAEITDKIVAFKRRIYHK
ncbi:flagellar protein FlbD [Clostridia bacterium]|nr:flagellar protein FlbD [Clostridia bacterium]